MGKRMKVRCIDNSDVVFSLVVGDEYEVEKEYCTTYTLVGGGQYRKERFEIVEEEKGMDKHEVEAIRKCKHAVGDARRYQCRCNNDIYDLGDCPWDDQSQCSFYVAEEQTELTRETVSTWEMIKALQNDCGLIAERRLIEEHYDGKLKYTPESGITWQDGTRPVLSSGFLDARWKLTKLKQLKKMTSQEMAKYYSEAVKGVESNHIKSVRTGRNLSETFGFGNMTEEEIDGLWTVEGVYEDEK